MSFLFDTKPASEDLWGSSSPMTSASLFGDSPEELLKPGGLQADDLFKTPMSVGLGPIMASIQAEKDDANAAKDYGELYKTDKAAAIDREKAKHELSGKFNVVLSAKDKKKPNDVTAAELEQVVATYSRIRRDETNIKFDAASEPEKFKANAMKDIMAILETQSGRDLIFKLADNTIDTVDPVTGKVIKGKQPHTTTISDHAPAGAAPVGQDGASTTPQYPSNASNPKVGSNTTIAINPGYPINQKAVEPWAQEARSDVVLYHEMVHALNDTQGTQLKGKVDATNKKSADDVGENLSEYQALGFLPNPLNVGEALYRKERKALVGTSAEITMANHPLQSDATMPERPKYHMTEDK